MIFLEVLDSLETLYISKRIHSDTIFFQFLFKQKKT
jgi:hypothetical protein